MLKQDNAKRERAERLFKTREEQKADAPKATAEYYAAQQKLLARTQELRQLRLQREAQMKSRSAYKCGISMPSTEYSPQKRFDLLLGSVVLSALLLVGDCFVWLEL